MTALPTHGTGGREERPADALPLIRRSYGWPVEETGLLAKAECSLEIASEDLARALGDFVEMGTRPGWVAETKRLLRRVETMRSDVRAELDS